MPANKRLVLKLSGELLAGGKGIGVDAEAIARFADEIADVAKAGWEVAVVVGGGNFFRGRTRPENVTERTGDRMGMLGSAMSAMALCDVLSERTPAQMLSGVPLPSFAELYKPETAEKTLAAGSVVILAGGTGQPGFSTDTAAAIVSYELSCDVLLKGTDVDGVYDKDPQEHTDAKRFDHLTYDEALAKQLKVMDMTAFAICRERKIPMVVFDVTPPGAILAAAEGRIGTRVSAGV